MRKLIALGGKRNDRPVENVQKPQNRSERVA
jgi:hypothetical protein